MYDFSLLNGLDRVTLCGIGELGCLHGGSTCPTAFCMRSSSVSKGTTCSSGCHKHQRKCWMVEGGEEYSLNLSCASCRFCVMYKGGVPVPESSAVGCPQTCMVVLSDLLRLACSVLTCVSSDM